MFTSKGLIRVTWSIDTICCWYVVHWWRYRLNRVIEAIAEVWVWDERPWFNKKKKNNGDGINLR